MGTPDRESALIVPIRLPPALAQVRLRETRDGPAGVPGHVTVLYPFVPPDSIDRAVLAAVAQVIGTAPAFDVRFCDVRRWEPGEGDPGGVVWLEPVPSEPFNELTRALFAAFPAYPPYGGIHDETIAHVSLAAVDWRHRQAVEAEARRWLPFRRRVSAATLIVEGANGRWRTRARFPFGADPP
ncbi:MAG: 2'-5' RNA ligase family protein [Chloroflexi bacterium]|nr:2'-5' RNA ligase family protein [Chloroflexota bacterium]